MAYDFLRFPDGKVSRVAANPRRASVTVQSMAFENGQKGSIDHLRSIVSLCGCF